MFVTFAVTFMTRKRAARKRVLHPAQSLRICPRILFVPSAELVEAHFPKNNKRKTENFEGFSVFCLCVNFLRTSNARPYILFVGFCGRAMLAPTSCIFIFRWEQAPALHICSIFSGRRGVVPYRIVHFCLSCSLKFCTFLFAFFKGLP